VKRQRCLVLGALSSLVGAIERARPRIAHDCVVVRLERVAPRALDDDNLRGALKAVRDAVAEALGIDDADPRVRWQYGQAVDGRPRFQAVRIQIAEQLELPLMGTENGK